jgi:hypothetical protein
MTPARAEDIAMGALVWLCAQDDLFPVFLASSGASAEDLGAVLRSGAGPDQGVLSAVLDFILMRDDTVMAACAEQGLAYDQLAVAQAVLSGAGQMHWT